MKKMIVLVALLVSSAAMADLILPGTNYSTNFDQTDISGDAAIVVMSALNPALTVTQTDGTRMHAIHKVFQTKDALNQIHCVARDLGPTICSTFLSKDGKRLRPIRIGIRKG
jgi:hypothetical protein